MSSRETQRSIDVEMRFAIGVYHQEKWEDVKPSIQETRLLGVSPTPGDSFPALSSSASTST